MLVPAFAAAITSVTGDKPIVFDPALIKRLCRPGPRYTSYPTADRFENSFGYRDYLQAVAGLRTRASARALSLYVHIPFCDTVNYTCASDQIVTKNRDKAAVYLSFLKREIEMQGRLFAGLNQVGQLHFGGGAPTYLSDAQMEDLMLHLRRAFQFAPDEKGEYSIEIDPRTVSRERMLSLRRQGFNRISLGVHDYDAGVQQAINRVQSEAGTDVILDAAREAGYRSVRIDLIYGLPRQNLITMAATIDKVIAANPDRIALRHYDHLLQLFKPQRGRLGAKLCDADLPGADLSLAMLALCIRTLSAAGYVHIGIDHFAKPGDDLAIAQVQGRLHCNFQGYSVHPDMNLVACGVSAISSVGATYSQNVATLDAYYDLLERNELPIERGVRLNMDDLLRRTIIQMLMCQFELSIPALEQAYPIAFADYFGPELKQLALLEADGLVTLEPEWVTVTPAGRYLIRNVCMVFDRYLGLDAAGAPGPHTP